jgi:hypothetical protein
VEPDYGSNLRHYGHAKEQHRNILRIFRSIIKEVYNSIYSMKEKTTCRVNHPALLDRQILNVYAFTEATPEIIRKVPPVLQGIIFCENGLGTGKRYFLLCSLSKQYL